VALLALSTLRERAAALAFLALFALASVLGMVLVTLLLSTTLHLAVAGRTVVARRLVTRLAAAASVVMGLWLLTQRLFPEVTS
jgi:hypothetical protein